MGAIQKIGNFLGISKFGQGIATSVRNMTGEIDKDIQVQRQKSESLNKITYAFKNEKDPVKKARLKELLKKMNDEQINNNAYSELEKIDPGINLSNKEIIGSAANVGLNVFTPGAFKGGKAAILAKNAAQGAGYGLASGLEKNRDTSGIIGSTVGGTAVGTAIGATGLMVKAAREFMGNKVPEWMMNKAVKPALQDLKKNVRYGTNTLGKELLDEGVKGGPKKLLEIADNKTSVLENQLQSVLNQPGLDEARITRNQIIPYVKELTEQKAGTPGMKGDVQRIKNIIDDIPEEMTLQEANQMKRRIYQELKDLSFKLDAKLATKGATLKQIAKGLKTEIENTVGGTVVKDINQKLSIYGRLENLMTDQLAREMRNNGVSLTDAILVAGGDTGILALLRHIGKGTETYAAQGLYKAGKVGTGKIGTGISNVIKKAAFNLP